MGMTDDDINEDPVRAKADFSVVLTSNSDSAVIPCNFVSLQSNYILNSLIILFKVSKKPSGEHIFAFV